MTFEQPIPVLKITIKIISLANIMDNSPCQKFVSLKHGRSKISFTKFSLFELIVLMDLCTDSKAEPVPYKDR